MFYFSLQIKNTFKSLCYNNNGDYMKDNGWINLDKKLRKEIESFGDEYISFLNEVKTEREACSFIVSNLIKNGYEEIGKIKKLKQGDKVFYVNKNKSVYAAVIGKNDIEKGLNIIGSHIDSPRLDLKPNPIIEDNEQVMLKTQYYGVIKKYQWTSIPLCMRGVVIKENGEKININIGEKKEDPIFTITDLLPHLAKEQSEKKLSEAIEGESLNILIGNSKVSTDDTFKSAITTILSEKYNITEEDLTSAEIEFVPAFEAKSLGFDSSMVAGYGQDDKACAYTSLQALLKIENPDTTAVAIFADKEEIGSMGNTGMMSNTFDSFIIDLLLKKEKDPYLINHVYRNSKMLSADVDGAFDANYPNAFDKNNASRLGHGVCINKYTGGRGKSSASDANSEYLSYIKKVFKDKVKYQFSVLGKIDLGGGGTIAYILANKGVDVVDCGVPVLSMHSPYEVTSKFDIYTAYNAYYEFYNN